MNRPITTVTPSNHWSCATNSAIVVGTVLYALRSSIQSLFQKTVTEPTLLAHTEIKPPRARRTSYWHDIPEKCPKPLLDIPLIQRMTRSAYFSSPLSNVSVHRFFNDPNNLHPQYHESRLDKSHLIVTRYNLCENLNDEDWQSMTAQETSDMQHYFNKYTVCRELTSRFDDDVTSIIYRVAQQMEYNKPLTIELEDRTTAALKWLGIIANDTDSTSDLPSIYINTDDKITMSNSVAYDLIGWNGIERRNEALGTMAHEISHRILNHIELRLGLLYNLQGLGSCPTFDESEYQSSNSSISSPTANLELNKMKRNQEKEADLFTLKIPELGRGMRDALNRIIEENKNRCSNQLDTSSRTQDFCKSLFKHSDESSHPPMVTRLNYMTEALCLKYPELNQDNC